MTHSCSTLAVRVEHVPLRRPPTPDPSKALLQKGDSSSGDTASTEHDQGYDGTLCFLLELELYILLNISPNADAQGLQKTRKEKKAGDAYLNG